MRQYLIYACTNKYERAPLELVKQVCVKDNGNPSNANAHMSMYKEYFRSGEYSAIHVLVMELNAMAGTTEIVINEYAEGPLCKRIVINESARKDKSNPYANALLATMAGLPQAVPLYEEPIHD